MFRALYSLACIFILLLWRSLFPTQMLIGVDVPTRVGRLLVIVCFLETTSSPGRPRGSPHFPVPVLRLSIGALLMWFQNHVGFATYYWSFTSHFLRLLWCIAIMSVPSISPAILSSISALSILRWTFTLFGKRSPVVRPASFMFFPVTRLQISSPKAFLEFFLTIFGPV